MPVRFLSNGVVEVDTLSEAIAWETRKSKTLKSVGRPRKLKPNPVDANPWERFCIDIRAGNCTRMRKILGIVRGRGQAGIDLHELSSSVGDSNALNTSGNISGIRKKGEKYGLNAEDLIVRGPDKLFRPGRMLEANEPPLP